MTIVDGAVERAITSLEKDLAVVRDQIDNVAASEASLDSKIEKRKAELERCEKRLQAMQKIKYVKVPLYQKPIKIFWVTHKFFQTCLSS